LPFITGDNIVIRSASGRRNSVTIRGGGMFPSSATENGFGVRGNNVTIADLTIRDVGNHGIQVSGHNLFVHNVRIQDTYEQMIKGATAAETIEFGTVQCSLLEYTAGIGPNWYIGGLDIHKGQQWIVSDNVFKDISSPNQQVAEHAVHFWNNCLNNTIERNIIVNCDRGVGFGLGQNGNQNRGGIIRNNMIYNDGTGLFDDVGIGLESSPDTEVYNNSIYIDYPRAIEYRFETTINVRIGNNLTNKDISSRNGASGTLFSNVTTAPLNWFVDAPTGNLRLASEISTVIDQGTDLGRQVAVDIDQNNRPSGVAYDIGAHELQGQAETFDCTEIQANIGDICNDNDPNTILDVIQDDCSCRGAIPPNTFDCPEILSNYGDSCNDNDENTINDVIQEDCTCAGVLPPTFDCPILEANIGDACDDNNTNTTNDVIQDDCSCAGTAPPPIYDCPELDMNIGDSCDDNNADTTNDVIQDDCSCLGTTIPIILVMPAMIIM